MRRKNRKTTLTEAQIQERKREKNNLKRRRKYESKQKKLFLSEYEKICAKYGCFVLSYYGTYISKQKQGEKIYTISSHLKSLKRDLDKE